MKTPSIAGLLILLSFPIVAAGQTAETLVLFDPLVPETPESIVFDRFDNAYISLAQTGEIRKVAPDGTQTSVAFLPIDAPCGPQPTVAIEIEPDRTAGAARVHATLPAGLGCDEFAFDVHGSIYCTTDPTNVVIRLDPDGTSEILLTAADGLDGPTSAAFGRRGQNRKNLHVTNAAFPIFTTTFRPSLMRLRLDVVGAP